MSTYNKNVSNQSGLSIDNINVKNTVELPNITIDTVNGASFNGVIVCNKGIQLNSTSINYLNNYLGYMPQSSTFQAQIGHAFVSGGYARSVYSVALTPGVYLLRGQLEYFNYVSTPTVSYIMTSISNINDTYNPNISNSYKCNANYIMQSGESFIQEVNTILNITSNTTYYLVGNIYFTGTGPIIAKTNTATTNSTTIASAQTALTTFTFTTTNANIYPGMKITGTGINQPCYVASTLTNTVTFTTTQTIAANTIITFSTNASSSLTAVRIA